MKNNPYGDEFMHVDHVCSSAIDFTTVIYIFMRYKPERDSLVWFDHPCFSTVQVLVQTAIYNTFAIKS